MPKQPSLFSLQRTTLEDELALLKEGFIIIAKYLYENFAKVKKLAWDFCAGKCGYKSKLELAICGLLWNPLNVLILSKNL